MSGRERPGREDDRRLLDGVPLEEARAVPPRIVHIVSHGPHCLDGVAAAAAIARFHRQSEVRPRFCGNSRINEALLELPIESPFGDQELWITDISWTSTEVDARLRQLAERGLRIYWIDHHRTAIERVKSGRIDLPFADCVVDDRYAASRLVFDRLLERSRREGRASPDLERFRRVVEMADDNDRWLHRIPGSRELALAVRALNGVEAYEDLLAIDENVTYTPRMQAALRRVEGEVRNSLALAEATRSARQLPGGIQIVAAVCDGYPSEIADRWGRQWNRAVFVFFDLRSLSVSYRRSPDCPVDLSKVAEAFGGGGHPAAAGSEMPELLPELSRAAAERVAAVVGRLSG